MNAAEMMEPFFEQKPYFCLRDWCVFSAATHLDNKPNGYLTDEESNRLISLLEQQSKDYYMLGCSHHPLLNVGTKWLDAQTVSNAEKLLDTIRDNERIRFWLHGHIHQQSEVALEHFTMYGTPSTCFQFKPKVDEFALDIEAKAGWRWVNLLADKGRFETEVCRLNRILFGNSFSFWSERLLSLGCYSFVTYF